MNKFLAALMLCTLAAGAQADSTANANSASGANSGSASGANAVITLNSVNHGVKQDYPAYSAASLMIQSCQEGVSAQNSAGGFAAAFDSAQCVSLRQAAIHLELYDRYHNMKMYKQANAELAKFHGFLEDADDAADVAYYPKEVGGAVTAIIPIALLFLVF